MPTSLICDIEPFRYQSTPQTDGQTGASSAQINDVHLEDYLNRLREALCADIESIIDECCNGGGGGGAETFLELSDTPSSYAGQANKMVTVNAGQTGLGFTTVPSASSSGLHKNYSTSEQATDRTWIDARTVYQITVDFGALPAAGAKTVAHGITNLDLVIAWEFWAKNPTTSVWFHLPHATNSAVNDINANVNGANLSVTVGVDRSAWTTSYCTLFYVKTP